MLPGLPAGPRVGGMPAAGPGHAYLSFAVADERPGGGGGAEGEIGGR
jgi:hypothetical protein